MPRRKAATGKELRRRAEKKVAKQPGIMGKQQAAVSSYETKKLIHELQVHQAELEIQNEDLRKAQVELADTQRRYMDLFNFAPVGYFVLDPEGVIRQANVTASGTLDVTKWTLVGRPLSFYVHSSDRVVFNEHIREALSSEKRATCVVRMKKGSGGLLQTQLESARLEEVAEGPPYCLTAMTDISKLKELEKEREAYIRDLEGFSYTASHELRGPLVSIAGFARILSEDFPSCLDEKGRDYLKIITENTQKMERLLADLLAFSQTAVKKVVKGRIDVESLARSAWAEVALLAGRRNVRIDIGHLPPAMGDESMIRQALVNLLSNSLKFTAARETAVIEVHGQKGKGENTYSVRDNGAGFDMKYADKLFSIFQRLHGSKEFPGTGAGLSIVRRIIEKHGGRVWAEGKPDQGATFYFTLPAR